MKKKRRSNKKVVRNENRNNKIKSEDTDRCHRRNRQGVETLENMSTEIQSNIEKENRNIIVLEEKIEDLKTKINENKTELLEEELDTKNTEIKTRRNKTKKFK